MCGVLRITIWLALACAGCSRSSERAPEITVPPPEFNQGLHWVAGSAVGDPPATRFALVSTRDVQGRPYGGAKFYRLIVPAGVPANDGWSVAAYDPQAHTLLQTERPRVAWTPNAPLQSNPDGSIEIWIGPNAPDDRNAHWLATDPTRGFELRFEFDAPASPLFAKTWKLPNVERTHRKSCGSCSGRSY